MKLFSVALAIGVKFAKQTPIRNKNPFRKFKYCFWVAI
jgi:hypothetical protein